MRLYRVSCSQCNKIIFRDKRRINEAKKFGWKTYCSDDCQSKAKNFQILIKCSCPGCNNLLKRRRNQFKKSKFHFCSRSCATIVNNSRFPKRIAKIKQCAYCGKEFKSLEKYCSKKCKDRSQVVTKERIINWINKFYRINGRIPFKNEYSHYHAARLRFGTWNKAIKAAGFEPNPVMFAKKHIANDGHKCDSLAEKIIDDWLYSRCIKHEVNYPYPGDGRYTADFKVEDFWIEFFGLNGEHRRYDELKKLKLKLAKKKKLKLMEVYPEHLFPKSILDKVLSALIN